MAPQPLLQDVKTYPALPLPVSDDSSSVPSGKYVVQANACDDENEPLVWSEGSEVKSEIWFKSPPLDEVTIYSLQSIQLLAESRDQGEVDDASLGNWTWFELAIYEDESSHAPREENGIKLVWQSHKNRFESTSYGWFAGLIFDRKHDLLNLLKPNNIIVVQVCSRFQGWALYARGGYLIFDIGNERDELPSPPPYSEIFHEVTGIQKALDEINDLNVQSSGAEIIDPNAAAFRPQISVDLGRADAYSSRDKDPLRVLSLDGGGVRGLVSLLLLQAVLDKAAPGKKPYQVFDMIGGTSTGGLIAIMLGRLKMSVSECLVEYGKFMGEVFPATGLVKKGAKLGAFGEFYDSSKLESIIKKLIRDKLGRDDVPLLDEESEKADGCKIFLLAVNSQAGNNRAPVFLRSYKAQSEYPDTDLANISLWQAARATSAAPGYFKPLKVGGHTLVDGGLGANNPLGWLWTEVLSVFGPARTTDCFLSIGTGMAKNVAVLQPGIMPSHDTEISYASVATNTELTHILFRTLIDSFAPQAREKKYWRLNIQKEIPGGEKWEGWLPWKKELVKVLDNFEDPGDLDDVKALEKLKVWTKQFITQQEKMIDHCAAAIRKNLDV